MLPFANPSSAPFTNFAMESISIRSPAGSDTYHSKVPIIYAEVDLKMKAKALAKYDVPGNARSKRWPRDPSVSTSLRTLRVQAQARRCPERRQKLPIVPLTELRYRDDMTPVAPKMDTRDRKHVRVWASHLPTLARGQLPLSQLGLGQRSVASSALRSRPLAIATARGSG
jgi:hypothetical protein